MKIKETANTISFDILAELIKEDWVYWSRYSVIENVTTLTISTSQAFIHVIEAYREIGGEYIEVEDGYSGWLWWKKPRTRSDYKSKYGTIDVLTIDGREYITKFHTEDVL